MLNIFTGVGGVLYLYIALQKKFLMRMYLCKYVHMHMIYGFML